MSHERVKRFLQLQPVIVIAGIALGVVLLLTACGRGGIEQTPTNNSDACPAGLPVPVDKLLTPYTSFSTRRVCSAPRSVRRR